MDKQHKLIRRFRILVFSLLCSLFILAESGCRRDDDATNQLRINNQTQDTLILQVTKKYISDTPGYQHIMPPKHHYILTKSLHNSGLDIIQENWGNSGDTVEILKDGIIIIKWGGPLRILHDTINHFFNENSWDITQGGKKCKWEIVTFTIYESDLGKIEGN